MLILVTLAVVDLNLQGFGIAAYQDTKREILVLLKSMARLPLDSRRQQGFTKVLDAYKCLQPRKVIVGSLLRHQIV